MVPTVYAVERDLRKREQSLRLRLTSIQQDARFVRTFVRSIETPLPLAANLRCGEWYVPQPDHCCYFKSADGHYGEWQFNLRRLNLELLKLTADRGGVVIVDSTRKGKVYPDSFTRTLPIWASVISRALWTLRKERDLETDDSRELWCGLHMGSGISSSEAQMVETRCPLWVESLLSQSTIAQSLRRFSLKIEKPLRCLLFNPTSHPFSASIDELPFTPIFCLCASRAQANGTAYIQGAGDDHETWAHGLTPRLFWDNVAFLLSIQDEGYGEVEERVDHLVKQSRMRSTLPMASGDLQCISRPVEGIPQLHVGTGSHACTANIWTQFDAVVNFSALTYPLLDNKQNGKCYLHVSMKPLSSFPKGSLSRSLPTILKFVWRSLKKGRTILLHTLAEEAILLAVIIAIRAHMIDPETGAPLDHPAYPLSKEDLKDSLYFVQQNCTEQMQIPRKLLLELNRFFLTAPRNMSKEARVYYQELGVV
eukprot:TRINITY_DN12392_c0_g1_i1.p1 TRINITY_DN12392_c0_g1~~TRINITY_DN12392_c0_g1_i1.p1  ORF type:complete len:480 (-),score=25.56 TRINITY_DN12392_c0_g1_i1:26-1465(-)